MMTGIFHLGERETPGRLFWVVAYSGVGCWNTLPDERYYNL